MVPVEVQARQVEIDQRRVSEVLQPELQARATYGEAAQNFELAKYRIEKEAEIRIAGAQALVSVTSKITANVYGTPEDVAKMNAAFLQGMGLANMASGFLSAADDSTLAVAKQAAKVTEGLISAASKRLDPTKAE
jgi:hypothetical protein